MRPAAAARSQRRPRRGAALRPGSAGAEAAPLPSAGPFREPPVPAEAAGKPPEEGVGEGAGGDAARPWGLWAGCPRRFPAEEAASLRRAAAARVCLADDTALEKKLSPQLALQYLFSTMDSF